jgi:protocatechuate 3,4-dioxygenase beta subunit
MARRTSFSALTLVLIAATVTWLTLPPSGVGNEVATEQPGNGPVTLTAVGAPALVGRVSSQRSSIDAAAAGPEADRLMRRLRVLVTHSKSGAPVGGMRMFIEPYEHRASCTPITLQTDSRGVAETSDIPSRTLAVLIPGVGDELVEVAERGETVHRVEVSSACIVRGNVVDQHRRPVAGASVWLSAPDTRTGGLVAESDANGSFRLECVGSGSILCAYARDHAPSPVRTVQESASSDTEVMVDLRLGPSAGSLAIDLQDHNGQAVSGAAVYVGPRAGWAGEVIDGRNHSGAPAHRAISTSEGTCRVDGVPVGLVSIHVGHDDHAPLVSEVEVAAGRCTAVSLRLSSGGRIEGHVTDEDARPVVGATVAAALPDTFFRVLTKTDEHGHYVLERTPVGDLVLGARTACERVAQRGQVRVEPGTAATWDVRMQVDTCVLQGEVRWEGGLRSAADYIIIARSPEDRRHLGRTRPDERGRFELTALRAATAELTLWRADEPALCVAFATGPVSGNSFELVERGLDPQTRIAGTMAGLRSAWLEQLDTGETKPLEVDAAAHRFRGERLPAGKYRLHLVATDGQEKVRDVELHKGECRDLGVLLH